MTEFNIGDKVRTSEGVVGVIIGINYSQFSFFQNVFLVKYPSCEVGKYYHFLAKELTKFI